LALNTLFYLRINIETDIICTRELFRENLDKISTISFFIKKQKLNTILNI